MFRRYCEKLMRTAWHGLLLDWNEEGQKKEALTKMAQADAFALLASTARPRNVRDKSAIEGGWRVGKYHLGATYFSNEE